MSEQPSQDNRWHLDRRVPIVLVVTLLAQFAGIIWWGAGISGRVSELEKLVPTDRSQESRLVRLETLVETTTDQLKAIDDKLDRLLNSRLAP